MRYLANGTRMWTIQYVFKSLEFQFITNQFAIAGSFFLSIIQRPLSNSSVLAVIFAHVYALLKFAKLVWMAVASPLFGGAEPMYSTVRLSF